MKQEERDSRDCRDSRDEEGGVGASADEHGPARTDTDGHGPAAGEERPERASLWEQLEPLDVARASRQELAEWLRKALEECELFERNGELLAARGAEFREQSAEWRGIAEERVGLVAEWQDVAAAYRALFMGKCEVEEGEEEKCEVGLAPGMPGPLGGYVRVGNVLQRQAVQQQATQKDVDALLDAALGCLPSKDRARLDEKEKSLADAWQRVGGLEGDLAKTNTDRVRLREQLHRESSRRVADVEALQNELYLAQRELETRKVEVEEYKTKVGNYARANVAQQQENEKLVKERDLARAVLGERSKERDNALHRERVLGEERDLLKALVELGERDSRDSKDNRDRGEVREGKGEATEEAPGWREGCFVGLAPGMLVREAEAALGAAVQEKAAAVARLERDLADLRANKDAEIGGLRELLAAEQRKVAGMTRKDMQGASLIAAERLRQVTEEGYSLEMDASDNTEEQLAVAAVLYAAPTNDEIDEDWPWDLATDKRPRDHRGLLLNNNTLPRAGRIRQLEKAGAFVAAEIDRLIRLEEGTGNATDTDGEVLRAAQEAGS